MKTYNEKYYSVEIEGGYELGMIGPNPYYGSLPHAIKSGWRFKDNNQEFIYLKELKIPVSRFTEEYFYIRLAIMREDGIYFRSDIDDDVKEDILKISNKLKI
jgi:hypothetical protein